MANGLSSNGKPLLEHAGPMPEDWANEERSYIFECRLGRAQQLKAIGNEHFRQSEWALAHVRYMKALYHAHFDELQCWDLMDTHKDMLRAVQGPVKLNNVVCILKLAAAGDELDTLPVDKGDGEAETWIDRAEELCNEVIKSDPQNPKAHYRKSQVLEHRGDTSGAERCLDEVEKLEGKSGTVRTARARLREQRKAARARERELFGGLIQESSIAEAEDAAAERREARRALILRVTNVLGAPVTWPAGLLLRLLRPLWALVERLSAAMFNGALRNFLGDDAVEQAHEHQE